MWFFCLVHLATCPILLCVYHEPTLLFIRFLHFKHLFWNHWDILNHLVKIVHLIVLNKFVFLYQCKKGCHYMTGNSFGIIKNSLKLQNLNCTWIIVGWSFKIYVFVLINHKFKMATIAKVGPYNIKNKQKKSC